MRWGTPRRPGRRERGAGSLEYLGLFAVVALVISVGVGANVGEGVLVKHVQYGLCKVFASAVQILGATPASKCEPASSPRQLPQCTVHKQERLLGVNGSFRFIRGEIDGTDSIETRIDPVTGKEVTYVTLGGKNAAGVGAGDKQKLAKLKKKPYGFGGKVQLEAGGSHIYKFDSREEAEAFLEQRRGNQLERAGGAITGGKLDGLWDLGHEAWNKIRGNEHKAPKVDGVQFDLGEAASGSATLEKDVKKAGVELKGGLDAKAQGSLRLNRDGTSQIEVKFEGGGTLEGGAGLSEKGNKELLKKYPLLEDLKAGGHGKLGGATGYTIKFDKNGKPKTLIYTTETTASGGAKVGRKEIGFKGSHGRLKSHTYTLDLTDPENAAAFKDTWTKYGWSPALFAAIPYLDTPLSRRLADSSVEYEQVYATKGHAISGDSAHESEEKGVHKKGVGLGYNDETSSRTLTSARYIDHRQPGATWRTLANCKGGG